MLQLARQYRASNWRWVSPQLFLVLIVAATYLPFVGQAFHIDDRIYLEVAANIVEKPFFPYDYSPVFEGLISPEAASHSHLPLIAYLIAFIHMITGSQAEWIYHLAFLVFPLLAALGFYQLAKRYVRFPLAAACLLVLAPVFLVLSHSVMTDIPLLAFWIVSLFHFLRIVEGQGRRRDWIACGLSLLAAGFISLLSGGLILLMAACFIMRRDRSDDRLSCRPSAVGIVCLLALPVLLWGIWYLRAYFYYDRFVLFNTFLHMDKRDFFSSQLMVVKALSFMLNVGAVFVFPAVLWCAFAGRISLRLFLLVFLVSFVPFYIWWTNWSELHIFLFALFMSSGFLTVSAFLKLCFRVWVTRASSRVPLGTDQSLWAKIVEKSPLPGRCGVISTQPYPSTIVSSQEHSRAIVLLLWFFGVFFSSLFFHYSGSARYCVLALPPVILFCLRALENRVKNPHFLRNLVLLAVMLTGVYGLTISSADHQCAAAYRKVAREICEDYMRPGQTVWFTGEWGFRYYLEQGGARIITRIGTGPKPGDIIVKPYVASPWVTLYDEDRYSDLLEQRHVPIKHPIRILDFSSHAGFYSTGWGILPFSITTGENWEWINVFKVKEKYRGSIPQQERHW